MKRWIALLMVVVLFAVPLYTYAESTDGELRHEVTGDISSLEIDEEAGLDRDEGETDASVRTEIYLLVDADTASYVTFKVYDDEGNILPNAQIYLTYNGIRELVGITDENGQCSLYLFRDVEYEYEVLLDGYRTEKGTFVPEAETKEVVVILAKYHTVNVFVKDKDQFLPGISVRVDGVSGKTDRNGKVTYPLVRGDYVVVVTRPDGTEIRVIVSVRGDTDVIIDISQFYGTAEGGYLVYDRYYHPEDYVLTKYGHEAEDLVQGTDESDADFAERVNRYLDENPSVILIEAQPDRVQQEDGPDIDVLREDGSLLYAQRSLMPMGTLLRQWEKENYTELVFTNEAFALSVSLAELHSPLMTKIYALADALAQNREKGAAEVVTAETLENEDGLKAAGLHGKNLKDLNVTLLDMDAIRDFAFAFDMQDEMDVEVLEDQVYEGAEFEFRITPILEEALSDVVWDELNRVNRAPEEIVLASDHYIRTKLTWTQAEGKLDETEGAELLRYLADGRLSAEEILELRNQVRKREITKEDVALLLAASEVGPMYRVSCWVRVNGLQVNFTHCLEEMNVLWRADEVYQAAYEEEVEALCRQYPEAEEEALKKEHAAKLDASVRSELESNTQFAVWDNLIQEETAMHALQVLRTMPLEENEFYDVIAQKNYARFVVDIRRQNVESWADEVYCWYPPLVTAASAQREEAYYFCADLTLSGLGWLEGTAE